MAPLMGVLADTPPALMAHLAAGVSAFVLGAALLTGAKGTRLHKSLGWAFVIAIAITAVAGLFVYEITGGLNPFHALSIFTLLTVIGGVQAARAMTPTQRASLRGAAVSAHASRMSWCVAALVIAAMTEALRLAPGPHPGPGPEDVEATFALLGGELSLALILLITALIGFGILAWTQRLRRVRSG